MRRNALRKNVLMSEISLNIPKRHVTHVTRYRYHGTILLSGHATATSATATARSAENTRVENGGYPCKLNCVEMSA